MSTLADDEYAVYDEAFPRARKPHRCAACCETIPVGARYARINAVFDGGAQTWKRCLRCQAIHEHLRDVVDTQDREWPDEELNCGHEYAEVHGEPPPGHIAALAFSLPGDEP